MYQVFISYRRDGGAAEARLLRQALIDRGKNVFLDVTDLRKGFFDEALLQHIAEAPNFLVILNRGSLERSTESQEDWLRQEIAQAIRTNRNIIPVMLEGFQFPSHLPDDLASLPRHQGISYSHQYFDAMLESIVQALDEPAPAKPEHPVVPVQEAKARPRFLKPGVTIGAVCALAVIGWVGLSRYGPGAKRPSITPPSPPSQFELDYEKGEKCDAAGDYQNAIVTFQQLARSAPRNYKVHERLAVAYSHAGDMDSAVKELEEYIQLCPGCSRLGDLTPVERAYRLKKK